MTLLHRTITVARRAVSGRSDTKIVVATDDSRIMDHAAEAGCDAVLTDRAIQSGTGRVLAAVGASTPQPNAVINLQGDSPFISPSTIVSLIDAVLAGAMVTTPVVQLSWEALDRFRHQKLASPFSGTTCIRTADGDARWFSKQVIPAIRDEESLRAQNAASPVFRHVGIYGYTVSALEQFERHPVTDHERLEGLEQLRFLEMSIPIKTVLVPLTPISMSGIDSPADLKLAQTLIWRHGDPHIQ